MLRVRRQAGDVREGRSDVNCRAANNRRAQQQDKEDKDKYKDKYKDKDKDKYKDEDEDKYSYKDTRARPRAVGVWRAHCLRRAR